MNTLEVVKIMNRMMNQVRSLRIEVAIVRIKN